jgi:hypothetical protein
MIVALDVESQQHFLPKFLRLGMAFDSNFARVNCSIERGPDVDQYS